MANGILVVDKPEGWTSQDVAAKLRGLLHEKHVGHGGTLDPMATGVLPIFAGRATRAASLSESAEKEYIAGLRLGIRTDTEDSSGNPVAEAPVTATPDEVRAAVAAMVGPRMQQPPMYSAVKLGGQKLYVLARQGKRVERPARPIEIFEAELLDGAGSDYRFRVRCSKGTYVRTLCDELGQTLGCGGCMQSLRRTRAGRFTLDEALTMPELIELAAAGELESRLQPVDSLFSEFPALCVGDKDAARAKNGAAIPCRGLPAGQYRVYGPGDEFLMLAASDGEMLRTIKSFFEVN